MKKKPEFHGSDLEKIADYYHLDKKKIVLETPIKTFGTYKLKVKLFTDVSAIVTVNVVKK